MPGASAGTAKALIPAGAGSRITVRAMSNQHIGAACAADEGFAAVYDVLLPTSSAGS